MSTHAWRVTAAGFAAYCVCSIAVSAGAVGQRRFDVLSADTIAAVRGMNVYTIRDNQIAACYSVFVIDPTEAPSSGGRVQEPLPTPGQLERARAAQALRDAIANHDRQVAALRQPSLMWRVEYETERARIEDEYEQAVRRVLPDVRPPAQVAPAWAISTREELDAAVRRAIAEAEAADKASARSDTDERIESLLRRVTTSANLAVTGPVACPPPAALPVR